MIYHDTFRIIVTKYEKNIQKTTIVKHFKCRINYMYYHFFFQTCLIFRIIYIHGHNNYIICYYLMKKIAEISCDKLLF